MTLAIGIYIGTGIGMTMMTVDPRRGWSLVWRIPFVVACWPAIVASGFVK